MYLVPTLGALELTSTPPVSYSVTYLITKTSPLLKSPAFQHVTTRSMANVSTCQENLLPWPEVLVKKKAPEAPAATLVRCYDRYVSTSWWQSAAYKSTRAETAELPSFLLTTGTRGITTFRSTTECIYDGGPIWYLYYNITLQFYHSFKTAYSTPYSDMLYRFVA
jgi:hypothetical protein